jgi:peptidyl-prolyl cis-trans isomerase SurA
MTMRLVAPLVLSLVVTGTARADVVERVVATVNNEAIFLSDLRTRAVPFLPQVAEAQTETERMSRLKELYDELLTLLIDERLIRQIARDSGIRVTDADIDNAIENIRLQNNMTEEQFQQALDAQGFGRARYRKDLRGQLLRLKVMNERVRSRVNVTEEEVRSRYERRARASGSEIRYQVSHVLLPIEPESTATEVAAVRQEADRARGELTADNFDERAVELGGGELGWISPEDLPETLGEALSRLSPGEISTPLRGNTGFHIFFVKDRQVGDFPTFDEMKQELYREMLDSAMVRQERVFLEEMRRKAVINRML